MLAELFYALSAIALILILLSVALIIAGKKSPFMLIIAGLLLLGIGITLAGEGLQIPTGTDEYSYYWECWQLRNNCSGTPEPDACEEYTPIQCLTIPDCHWNEAAENCIGEPELDSCEPYNQTQCEGIDNCTWNPATPATCAGTPEQNSCDAYNETQCRDIEDCNWTDAYCWGTPSQETCGNYDQDQCANITGCTWNAIDPYCEGTPDNCTIVGLFDPTGYKCEVETEGCYWSNATCNGEPNNCTWLVTYDPTGYKCNETVGCVVKWPTIANCTGNVFSCQQLDTWGEEKCNETTGCEWVETAANCTGDVDVTCLWLGAYDSTGLKCQETPGCIWNLTLYNGTCDRILINNTYLNMTGDWDSPNTHFDLLYYIYTLSGLFFIIWGAVNIYENRDEETEEE